MSSDNHSGIELMTTDGTGKRDTFEAAPTSQLSKEAEILLQEVEQQIKKNLTAKKYGSCLLELTPEFRRKEVKRLLEAASINKSKRVEALKHSVLAAQQNIAKIKGAPPKSTSTQTELTNVQDMGMQTGNEALSETLRHGVEREEAESCKTASDQCSNENAHEFWKNKVKRQIIDMLTEHNQAVESLNAQILLLDHDLNKQTGEKGPTVPIFTQTELNNVKNFGTQTETGEKQDSFYEIGKQLNVLKPTIDDLKQGFNNRTEDLVKISSAVAELLKATTTLSNNLEVVSRENTASLEKIISLESPIQKVLSILEGMASTGQLQARAIEANNTPVVLPTATVQHIPQIPRKKSDEVPASSHPVSSCLLNSPEVSTATAQVQISSTPEIGEDTVFSPNNDEKLQGDQQQNCSEGNAVLDEEKEINTSRAASNDGEVAIEFDTSLLQQSTSPVSVEESSKVAQNSYQQENVDVTKEPEEEKEKTAAVVGLIDSDVASVGRNAHESFEQFYNNSRPQSSMNYNFEYEDVQIPQNNSNSFDDLQHGRNSLNPFEPLAANERTQIRTQQQTIGEDQEDPQRICQEHSVETGEKKEMISSPAVSNYDGIAIKADREDSEIALRQITPSMSLDKLSKTASTPHPHETEKVGKKSDGVEKRVDAKQNVAAIGAQMNPNVGVPLEEIEEQGSSDDHLLVQKRTVPQSNDDRFDGLSQHGNDDADEQGPSEPSVSSKPKKMAKRKGTSQNKVTAQVPTGNDIQPVDLMLDDEELAKMLQREEFNMRERRNPTSLTQKRGPPESLSYESKKKKPEQLLDSPENDKVEWYTRRAIASSMFSDSIPLSKKTKEELKKLIAPTEEVYSERIPYKEDATFKELNGKLLQICSDDTLPGNQEEDGAQSDADSEVEIENEDQNNQAVQKTKKKAWRLNSVKKPHKTAPLKVMPLLFTSRLEPGITNQNGQKIVEIVKESAAAGENTPSGIYHSESVTGRSFFEQKGFVQAFGGAGEQLPITQLDYCDANLEKRAMSVSVSIITNIHLQVEQSGSASYSFQALKDDLGEEIIEVLRQRPESINKIARFEEKESSIITESHLEELQLSVFLEKHEKIILTAQEGYKKIVSDYPIKKEALLEVQQELNNAHRPHVEGKADYQFPLVYFGTNFDIPGEAENQQSIIGKLHKWLQPRQGLLSHFPEVMPGITQAQAYFSEPGCRLTARCENQGLGSVHLNLGPDSYEWFAVSMKYAVRLEQLFRDKKAKPYHSGIWLNEEILKEAGISYHKFEQKNGEIVVVNTAVYYWVQSNGFAKMISWNIMPASVTQLAATALFCDQGVAQGFSSVLPFQELLWEIAKKKVYANSEVSKLIKRLLISCLAHCKLEYERAEQDKWKIEKGSPDLFGTAVKCTEDNCPSDILFNLVFVEKHARKPNTRFRCLQCVRTTFKDKTGKDKCYVRYPIEDLVNIFDEYN
ncbi:hypothetical protein CAEBREN_02531 [Caenorhabditis brenneri]|uniref:JmjC domain-containing protein n=1 Tax=Caenorhabditis brenneri TaxID=135651 RepID=G0MAL5_CAEBE|nr:hypothetical protein CAEBREN_02531 [Caenorhabditis brenneri]